MSHFSSVVLFFLLFVSYLSRSTNPLTCPSSKSSIVSKSVSLHLHFCFARRRQCLSLVVRHPTHFKSLSFLLLLAGDIALNPGPSSNSSVRLAFTNIRSINSRSSALSHYITSNNIQIMALSETWLTNKDTNALIASSLPSGYQFYHVPRLNRTGGGVAFLAHDNITCNVVKSPTFNSFEHLVVNCKFKGQSVNFASIYCWGAFPRRAAVWQARRGARCPQYWGCHGSG